MKNNMFYLLLIFTCTIDNTFTGQLIKSTQSSILIELEEHSIGKSFTNNVGNTCTVVEAKFYYGDIALEKQK